VGELQKDPSQNGVAPHGSSRFANEAVQTPLVQTNP